MASLVPAPARPVVAYTFGPFEADLRQCELRKFGIRIKLERKAWQLLLTLLERPGQLITRAELERCLWGDGVFVDFEHGLNVAVKKVRSALCDSAEVPQFIETIPGEGYRFMAPVERVESKQASEQPRGLSSITLPVVVPNLHDQSQRSVARWRWVAVAVFAVLLATGFLGWTKFHHPAPLLRDSGWVLIADFENDTGEPVLDGTLEYALERELSNSEFVKVVPPERTGDVLQLMKRPLDSRIDRALGREICLRDGEIHALITGKIQKLGTTYVLSAEIVDPATGITAASFSEEDQHDSELAAAVRRLSGRVREGLGENPKLVQHSLEQLEKVTTPSLRALQLYSQATRLMRVGFHAGLAADVPENELLEAALKNDPDFASAHLLLAHLYAGNFPAKAKPHFERAFELANTVSERERLFITASYYFFVSEQLEKAADTYETLLGLYPEHSGAMRDLFSVYRGLGRFDDEANMAVRQSELRPHSFHDAVDAVEHLTSMNWQAGLGRTSAAVSNRVSALAQSQAKRALAMLQSQPDSTSREDVISLRLSLAFQNCFLRNFAQATSEFDIALHMRNPGDQSNYWLAGLAMTLGKLKDAQQVLLELPKPAPAIEAALAFYRGHLAEAKQHLERVSKDPGYADLQIAGGLMIRLGMMAQAENFVRKMIEEDKNNSIRNHGGSLTLQGELALAKGDTRKGIPILESSLETGWGASATVLAYESLADVYRQQRKPIDALRILEQGAASRGIPANFSSAYRMRLRLKLADLYRELGRVSDAEQVEAGLKKDLACADPDHPILVALQHRQESNVSGAQMKTVASAATK